MQQQQRPDTPAMESRPPTASSYDSSLNFSFQSKRVLDLDSNYGRHSSAPVTASLGQRYSVPQVSTSFCYTNGDGTTYSTPPSSATVAYSGSSSMEDYHPSSGVNGHSFTTSGNVNVDANTESNYAPPVYSEGNGHATWGGDYQSCPSPPDNFAVETMQQTRQPVTEALYSNSGNMRYFQASSTS